MKRKIIQVASTGSPHRIVALCDDGTLWISNEYTDLGWEKVKDIPQTRKSSHEKRNNQN